MNTPEKPRKMSRLEFLGAAAGAALGVFGGSACKTGESPPPTRVKGTVPTTTTTTLPDTAVPTTNSTTEAPTTTQAERVFASPEQEMQVRAVERNIDNFFTEVTPDVIEKYRLTTRFTPYPRGFTTVLEYNSVNYRVLGINLGTFPTTIGGYKSELAVYGVATEAGEKYVALTILQHTDPAVSTPWVVFDKGRMSAIFEPIAEPNTYGTKSANEANGGYKFMEGNDSLIARLNTTVGQPMSMDIASDPAIIPGSIPVISNPSIEEVTRVIMRASLDRKLGEALESYDEGDLLKVGILKSGGPLPQAVLTGYPSLSQALSLLQFNSGVGLFTNTPPLI